MFLGSFLAPVSEVPGFLVLCGEGIGKIAMELIIDALLGKTMSHVSALDLASGEYLEAIGAGGNFIRDLTADKVYWVLRPHLADILGGRLPGDDTIMLPRMVVVSRHIPNPLMIPHEISTSMVRICFNVVEKWTIPLGCIMGEMSQIRAWAKEGLDLLKQNGGFHGSMSRAA
jgi:hypothetical protein